MLIQAVTDERPIQLMAVKCTVCIKSAQKCLLMCFDKFLKLPSIQTTSRATANAVQDFFENNIAVQAIPRATREQDL